jgi:O-antigen ligase
LLIPAVFADRSGRSGTGSSSPARRFNGVGTLLPVLGIAVFCVLLVLLTIWLGRGLAWDRLLKSTPVEDMRFLIVPTLAAMIRLYLPLGSGFGSFERVYQVHEPDRLLQPTYANHAHNDWLEIALTGGIPAMTLLLVAIIVFCLRVRALFARGLAPSRELNLARLGLLVIFLMALASLGDYPLRVPSLACFFVVAVLWASCPLPKNQPNGAVI